MGWLLLGRFLSFFVFLGDLLLSDCTDLELTTEIIFVLSVSDALSVSDPDFVSDADSVSDVDSTFWVLPLFLLQRPLEIWLE